MQRPSLWLLAGLLLIVGLLFYRTIEPLMMAIFIAIILAVLFDPLHLRLAAWLGGRVRTSAILTTIAALLLVLIPVSLTLLMAGSQVMQFGKDTVGWLDKQPTKKLEASVAEMGQTRMGALIQRLHDKLPVPQQEQLRSSTAKLAESITTGLYDRTQRFLSNIVTGAIGFAIVTLSLYYFLADRELFLRELHRLLPLEIREEKLLTEKFQVVCRAVVLGTVAAGVVQAALAGIAFAVIGVPQFWLLIVLTMFCSFIPFLGSTVVWLPVAAVLLVNGQTIPGIGLILYGALVIGSADNLVRAFVIGDQAKLHPLVALVTALGALNAFGLWGIFIGPMVAAFLYALINLIRERFDRINRQDQGNGGDSPAGVDSAAMATNAM